MTFEEMYSTLLTRLREREKFKPAVDAPKKPYRPTGASLAVLRVAAASAHVYRDKALVEASGVRRDLINNRVHALAAHGLVSLDGTAPVRITITDDGRSVLAEMGAE